MRAITYSTFGPAKDVLHIAEYDLPQPGPGEVLVEIAFSGVNPSDVKARAGARPGVAKPQFPVICPHSDGSGTIVAVGAGVDPARIGARVWIWNGQWQRPMGTCATAITLPSEQAVDLPTRASLEAGATLGIPGLTAAHVVFGAGDVHGRTVLIHGGNGSVGHLAVQLAAHGGAQVIATARPEGAERCFAAGAHAVLDYRSDTLAQDILTANGDVEIDHIVDVEFGENLVTNTEVIAPRGTLAVYGSARNMTPVVPFGQLLFKAVKIDIALIYILSPQDRAKAIARIHGALDSDALSCPVDTVYGLEQTAIAHEAVEHGARRGAILIDPRK